MNSRIPSTRVTASILGAFIPLACADTGSDSDPHTQIRDSADIRIVENQTPPQDSRLPMRPVPSNQDSGAHLVAPVAPVPSVT